MEWKTPKKQISTSSSPGSTLLTVTYAAVQSFGRGTIATATTNQQNWSEDLRGDRKGI